MAAAVLVVDIGSSSVRCGVLRLGEDGRPPLAVEGTTHQRARRLGDDGTADAAELVQDVELAVQASVEAAQRLGVCVDHVAITCFVMNLVGVDDQGDPVTPLLSYAATGESVCAASKSLRAAAESSGSLARISRATGTQFYHSSYAAPQLVALEHSLVANIKALTTIPSLLIARWTGSTPQERLFACSAISISEAAWTGMLNIRAIDWDRQVLALLPPALAKALPEVADDARIAALRPNAAARGRWGAAVSEHVQFHLGVADGAAANVGSLCVDSRMVAVTVGTSAAARVVLERAAVGLDAEQAGGAVLGADSAFPPPGLWCYCLDRQRVLLGGALTDGGSLHEWARNTLKWDAGIEEDALALAPARHGLAVLPFLRGERSLGWADGAQMSIVGMTAATRPSHLLCAALEAVAMRLALVVRAIESALSAKTTVVASGSALDHSPLLRQALADCLERDLFSSPWARDEATSRGAALLALSAAPRQATWLPSSWADLAHCDLEPVAFADAARSKVYVDTAIPRQEALYKVLALAHETS